MNEPKPRTVELLPDRVIKRFRFPEEYFRELSVYSLGLEITAPLLERQEPDWIAIGRVEGIPYLNSDAGFDTALLARSVAILHGAVTDGKLCLCHIDNQPANILWDGHRYMLLDFADSRMDLPETDISHLLLFWAEEYRPQRFELLAKRFIKAYLAIRGLDPEAWGRCLEQSRTRVHTRRALFSKGVHKLPEDQREVNQSLLDRLLS